MTKTLALQNAAYRLLLEFEAGGAPRSDEGVAVKEHAKRVVATEGLEAAAARLQALPAEAVEQLSERALDYLVTSSHLYFAKIGEDAAALVDDAAMQQVDMKKAVVGTALLIAVIISLRVSDVSIGNFEVKFYEGLTPEAVELIKEAAPTLESVLKSPKSKLFQEVEAKIAADQSPAER